MERVGRPLQLHKHWCGASGPDPSTITRYSRGTCSMETTASCASTCGLSRFPSPGPPPLRPLASWGVALCPPQLLADLHASVSSVSGQRHTGY